MPHNPFYPIVNQKETKVYIPKSSHFSIGTSPYPAHQKALAIDIYHKISIDNYKALSPVSGKVLMIKEMTARKPTFARAIDREYLIVIENEDNPLTVFKILHVKPIVELGDQIQVGDVLGDTIINGYFAPWSSPHIHLELRSKDDAIRASGGLRFNLTKDQGNTTLKNSDDREYQPIKVKITTVYKEFLLATFPERLYYRLRPFYGTKGTYLNVDCILDGGVSHYKNGIALFNEPLNEISKPFVLNGQKIGNLIDFNDRFGLINFKKVKFHLNGRDLRGVSLFLANFRPSIKLIPFDMEFFSNSKGTFQNLTIF